MHTQKPIRSTHCSLFSRQSFLICLGSTGFHKEGGRGSENPSPPPINLKINYIALTATTTITKAFIKWIAYHLGWYLHHHIWADHGTHLTWPAWSIIDDILITEKMIKECLENLEAACPHTVGRSRSTPQVRQMCISVVYSEIHWLQDHGTRCPTNSG